MRQHLFSGMLLFLFASSLQAQQLATPDSAISLSQALDVAKANFPQLQAQYQRIAAAENKVDLAKNDALPRLDVHLQGNYATANNIYGLFYPQLSISPISGPVNETNNYQGIFGSAAGVVFFWEPVTFGQRKAKIGQAKAAFNEAQSSYDLALFTHQIHVVEAYLDHRLASELVKVQNANLDRARILYQSITVLTQSGLRPGVDTTLTKTEIAKATVSLNQAKERESVTAIQFNELLGYTGEKVKISGNPLSQIPPEGMAGPSARHPLLSVYQSKIEEAQFERSAIRRSYAPKLSFLANGFARGSGASIQGADQFNHGTKGLSFSKYNYSIGAMLTFPLLNFASVRYQSRIAEDELKAQELLLSDQQMKLENGRQIAQVRLRTAYQNAQETAVQAVAAKEGYSQIKIRYESGLTTLPEVYQALLGVNQAEADEADALTRIWKAHLYQAYVSGELNDFLTLVK
jgi:outer membrane protein